MSGPSLGGEPALVRSAPTPAELHRAIITRRAKVLNLFPEVTWDRAAGDDARLVVFGWDEAADFLVIIFEALEKDDSIALVTSSARHSKEWTRRLDLDYGIPEAEAGATHQPCRYAGFVFGDRIRAATAELSVLPSSTV